MRLLPPVPLVAVAFAAPVLANSLMAPAVRVPIGQSFMTVTPDREWNRMSLRPGPAAEVWSIDGEPLNAITFYAGIPDGQTLFRDYQKRVKPLPKFAGTMLLTDVPPLLEESYRIARDAALFTIDKVEPAGFGGAKGVKFSYSFTRANEDMRRRGEAYAAIVGGKLYMATYEAPALHFFEHDVAPARAVIASATIAG